MSYKSKFAPLGIPFVHIAHTKVENGKTLHGIAKGWIAIGNVSFGILFSCGGVAIGGIALGGLGIGLISLAGLALGALSIGGCAIGIIAGGGLGIGLHAAIGGAAIARYFAIGGLAIAENANNEASKEFFVNNLPANVMRTVLENARWFFVFLLIPILMPLFRRSKPSASGFDFKNK